MSSNPQKDFIFCIERFLYIKIFQPERPIFEKPRTIHSPARLFSAFLNTDTTRFLECMETITDLKPVRIFFFTSDEEDVAFSMRVFVSVCRFVCTTFVKYNSQQLDSKIAGIMILLGDLEAMSYEQFAEATFYDLFHYML